MSNLKKTVCVLALVILILIVFILLPAYKGFNLDESSPNAYMYFECECQGIQLPSDKCLGWVRQCRYVD